MPITLRHDATGVGSPAVGGDTKRKFGQTLVLQQQQIANDNLRRQQDRLFELGRMRFNVEAQRVRDIRMMRNDRAMMEERVKADKELLNERNRLQQEGIEAQDQRNWVMQNTRNLEGQVSSIRGTMGGQQYTPEGQVIYGDLMGKLRAIEAQRDTIRPQEYNELLNKWLDDADRSGLDQYVVKPPTIDETMTGNFKDLETGYGVFLQPDGKMDVREIDPSKVAAAKGGGGVASMSAADYFADDGKYESAKKRATQSLMDQYAAKNRDNPDAAEPVFSAEQVHEQMLKDFNEHQKFLQGLGGNQETAQQQTPQLGNDTVSSNPMPKDQQQLPQQPGAFSPQETKAQNQLMAMPRQERVEKLLPFHPETQGKSLDELINHPVIKEEYDRAVSLGLLEPGKHREFALEVLDKQLIDHFGIFGQKDAAPGVGVGDIKDQKVKDGIASLPKPKSAEDAAGIEGNYFVDPEGNVRMLPPGRR